MFIALDRERPLSDQIYDHLRDAILAGRLGGGDRLPPSRELARELSVSRNTVVGAYERLVAEGFVVTRRAGGTVVTDELPDPPPVRAGGTEAPAGRRRVSPPRLTRYARAAIERGAVFSPYSLAPPRGVIDFDHNVNLEDRTARREWLRLLRRQADAFEATPERSSVGDVVHPLSDAMAGYLSRTRGIEADPGAVRLSVGIQHALRQVLAIAVEPGEPIAVEDPHYLGIRALAAALGHEVVPVPVDEGGLRVDRLDRVPDRVRFLYTAPSHHWPTGAVLAYPRRVALLDWARRRDAVIFENDHNTQFRLQGRPLESLAGLDGGERVFHSVTFSRLFAPRVAISCVVVPGRYRAAFEAVNRLEGGPAVSRIEEHALARFVADGHLERLVRRAHTRARRARQVMDDALAGLGDLVVPPTSRGGVHVHVRVPSVGSADTDDLVAACTREGVAVRPDRPFYLRPPRHAGLVLGFGALSADQIREGAVRLGRAISTFDGDYRTRTTRIPPSGPDGGDAPPSRTK